MSSDCILRDGIAREHGFGESRKVRRLLAWNRAFVKVFFFDIESSRSSVLSGNLHLLPVSLIAVVTGDLSGDSASLLLIRLFNVHKIMLTRRYYERNCA